MKISWKALCVSPALSWCLGSGCSSRSPSAPTATGPVRGGVRELIPLLWLKRARGTPTKPACPQAGPRHAEVPFLWRVAVLRAVPVRTPGRAGGHEGLPTKCSMAEVPWFVCRGPRAPEGEASRAAQPQRQPLVAACRAGCQHRGWLGRNSPADVFFFFFFYFTAYHF